MMRAIYANLQYLQDRILTECFAAALIGEPQKTILRRDYATS